MYKNRSLVVDLGSKRIQDDGIALAFKGACAMDFGPVKLDHFLFDAFLTTADMSVCVINHDLGSTRVLHEGLAS
jgi:hypothetical protein